MKLILGETVGISLALTKLDNTPHHRIDYPLYHTLKVQIFQLRPWDNCYVKSVAFALGPIMDSWRWGYEY